MGITKFVCIWRNSIDSNGSLSSNNIAYPPWGQEFLDSVARHGGPINILFYSIKIQYIKTMSQIDMYNDTGCKIALRPKC
jgi:hypothetical protein